MHYYKNNYKNDTHGLWQTGNEIFRHPFSDTLFYRRLMVTSFQSNGADILV